MSQNPSYSGLKGIEEIDGKLQAVFNLTTPVQRSIYDNAGNARRVRATTDTYTRAELLSLIVQVNAEGGDVSMYRNALKQLETALKPNGAAPK